jgi:hypothetical protein
MRLFVSAGVIAVLVREGDRDVELRAHAPARIAARRHVALREVID